MSVTLYQGIENWVKEQIRLGAFREGDKLPTEKKLAEEFGVSRITSKRALDELERAGVITRSQGRGSFVASVRSVISATADRAVPVFGEPERGEKKTVAMILPYDILRGRLIEIVQSATETLSERGYHLTLHNSGANSADERRLLARLTDDSVSGIILYPTTDTDNIDILYDMWAHQISLVTVDKKIADVPISAVCANNYQGAFELTEHIIKNGHTKIGCLFNERLSDVYSVRRRYFGYCSAMRRYGIPIDYTLAQHDYRSRVFGMDDARAEKHLAQTLEMRVAAGMTAIVLENDYMAFEALTACQTAGIKVPGDLSIVGFDNLPQCEFSKPAITTCEQDFSKIGTLVGELMLEQIERRDFTFVEHSVPTRLCVRESVKQLGVRS